MLAPSPSKYWSAPCRWPGERVFIVGGGPSVLGQDLTTVKGRHVIVINSSYEAAPFGDYLIFADERWWTIHAAFVKATFRGQTVAATLHRPDGVDFWMRRKTPPGLSREADKVAIQFTTYTAAINLAAHLVGQGGKIILLGADGKVAADGRTHHHKPHKWAQIPGNFQRHMAEVKSLVPGLNALSIECVNASPGSAWNMFPLVELKDHVDGSAEPIS